MQVESLESKVKEFLSVRMNEIFNESSFDCDKFSVRFKYDDTSIKIIDDASLDSVNVKVSVNFGGSSVEGVIPFLYIPQIQGCHCILGNSTFQIVSDYREAYGITLTYKNDEFHATMKNVIYKPFTISMDSSGKGIITINKSDKKHKIPLIDFLIAVTGLNINDISKQLGIPFQCDKSYRDCVNEIADIIGPNNVDELDFETKANIISYRFLEKFGMNIKREGILRLVELQSFKIRANNTVLLEDISCNEYHFQRGTQLTSEMCEIIDALPKKTLKVQIDNKICVLHSISNYTFKVLGEILAEDIPSLNLKERHKLTLDDVQKLNASNINTIFIVDNKSKKEVSRNSLTDCIKPEDYLTIVDILNSARIANTTYFARYDQTNRVAVSFVDVLEEGLIHNINKITDILIEKTLTDETITLEFAALHAKVDPEYVLTYFKRENKRKLRQTPDTTNLYSYYAKVDRISADVINSAVTEDMIQVQDHQYGRLDSLDVSESTSTGKSHFATLASKSLPDKGITSPYYVVRDGKVTDELVYLSAAEEVGKNIANYTETFEDDIISVLHDGDLIQVPKSHVDYIESSPFQNLSLCHSTITFPGHSDCKRITMGCNEERQAVPTVRTARGYVNAGGESYVNAAIRGRDILSRIYSENKFIEVSKEEFLETPFKLLSIYKNNGSTLLHIKINNSEYTYDFQDFKKSPAATISGYNIMPVKNNIYYPDDIVLSGIGYTYDDQSDIKTLGFKESEKTDFRGGISLLQNLNVVFKIHETSTIDDSCVISSKLVGDDTLTSVYLINVSFKVKTSDLINRVVSNIEDYIKQDGLPSVGTVLKQGDVIFRVGDENRLCYRLHRGEEGCVVASWIKEDSNEKEFIAILATRENIMCGDKMAGRHGNKSVIAKIVPECDMPYDPETGFVADIILNPLGVPTRQNISQLLDIPLSLVARLNNSRYIIAPYAKNDFDYVMHELNEYHVEPKKFIDGRTGLYFERELNYGVISMYKLHHMVRGKLNYNNFSSKVNEATNMPARGIKVAGGQKIGEMETWVLGSLGCTGILQELFGQRADDAKAVASARKSLLMGEDLMPGGVVQNSKKIASMFIQYCINMKVDSDGTVIFSPMTTENIKSLSIHSVSEFSQLHSEEIFGTTNSTISRQNALQKWSWIPLNTEIVSPVWFNNKCAKQVFENVTNNTKITKVGLFRALIDSEVWLDKDDDGNYSVYKAGDCVCYNTGLDAVVELFKAAGLEKLVISAFPVIPQCFRLKSDKGTTAAFDWHLKIIIRANNDISRNSNAASKATLMHAIINYFGVNGYDKKVSKEHENLANHFYGKDVGKHGEFRTDILSKRIFSSGRSTIIPGDINSNEIGIPYACADAFYEVIYGELRNSGHPELRDHLQVLLKTLPSNKKKFNKLAKGYNYSVSFELFKEIVTNIMNNQIVVSGRQPTLHQYSIRGFYVKMVETNAIQINPLVCSGFNADFDGDQMWFAPVYTEQAKWEAMNLLGANAALKSPKNGSIVLAPAQDMIIGFYRLTMFKDNVEYPEYSIEDAIKYKSIDMLISDVDAGLIKPYQLVIYKSYISTAGRIIFNSYIPNAFTDDQYEEVFKINGLDQTKFKKLRYDGLVGKFGNVDSDIKKIKISDICNDLYEEHGREASVTYDILRRAGFHWADTLGISISVQDYNSVMSDVDSVAADKLAKETADIMQKYQNGDLTDEEKETELQKVECKEVHTQVKSLLQDFYDGLISEEDKEEAYMLLFKDSVKSDVNNSIFNKLERNNNIFIILDSGAKGKSSQLQQVSGFVGSLKRTSSTILKTPIQSNYLKGLTSFEAHEASKSTVLGLASTQKSTPETGYSERKSVNMLNGSIITDDNKYHSNDCGRTNWEVPIRWGSLKSMSISLNESYASQFYGKHVKSGSKYEELTGTRTVDLDLLELVSSGDLKTLELESETIDFMNVAKNSKINLDSSECVKILQGLIDVTITPLNSKLFDILIKNHVRNIETEIGTIICSYKMIGSYRTLLVGREARGNVEDLTGYNLPYLANVPNEPGMYVTTDKTMDYIEDNYICYPSIRLMIPCENNKGICAHCYGLAIASNNLVELGDDVGTVSAMTIAEPTSQLTISLVNTGGAIGQSIKGGAKLYDKLLSGKTFDSHAHVAPKSGYIDILGNKLSVVKITGEDGNEFILPRKVPRQEVPYNSGEYVKQGEILVLDESTATADRTECIVHPSMYVSSMLNSNIPMDMVLLEARLLWLRDYFNTFKNNNIDIFPKNFEILVRAQFSDSEPDDVKSTIYKNSGIMTRVTFEGPLSCITDMLADNEFKDIKEPIGNGFLSKISTASNIDSGECRSYDMTKFKYSSKSNLDIVKERFEPISIEEVNHEEVKVISESDISSIFGKISKSKTFMDTVEETTADSSSDTIEPVNTKIEITMSVPDETDNDSMSKVVIDKSSIFS